ncbi:MAG: ribonuclease H family protein [Bacteroidales bacterium]|nr:ribonuclease H family protein [Bacteroidales bacterium]
MSGFVAIFADAIMAKKERYYVVWQGHRPGIYTSWEQCSAQVKGVAGAQFKAFDTLSEAQAALRVPYSSVVAQGSKALGGLQRAAAPAALYIDDSGMTAVRPGLEKPPVLDALAVDAACSGNPGVMEYQGVYIPTRTRVFHYKSPVGTNNIGEFLALVHGLSYLKKHGLKQILYTDSANAMSWVRQGVCKSKLPLSDATAPLWDFVHRAENWLKTNTYTTEIRKWDTDRWGEIPADFGRK